MNISLENKRAVVCGSTQGIGMAIAELFASLGASVTLIARNAEALEQVLRSLPASGTQQHDYLTADFSDPERLKTVISKRFGSGSKVEILVNNTGGPAGGPITTASTDDFEKTFRQHLVCNHILVQALLPCFRNAGYGRIINVISTSVKQPLKGLGVSNTIRAAVANWSKTLATELAPEGITVNNILPGATATARLSSLISAKAKKTSAAEEEVTRQMVAEIPMGRFAEPTEIAAAAAFLASSMASYITGINIPVDGGRTGCL